MAQGTQFYCGNGNSSTWSLDKCRRPAQAFALRLGRLVSAGAARRQSVRDVELLHEDGLAAIQRVYQTGPETLIYVDPPYVGHEEEYRYRIDYPAMVETAESGQCKGRGLRVAGRRQLLLRLEPR